VPPFGTEACAGALPLPLKPETSNLPWPRIVDTAEDRVLTSGPDPMMNPAAYVFLALHALVVGTGSRSAGL
jgi:hypothetical protein